MVEGLTAYMSLLIMALIVMVMLGFTIVITVGAAAVTAIIILTYGPPIIIKVCNWVSGMFWKP